MEIQNVHAASADRFRLQRLHDRCRSHQGHQLKRKKRNRNRRLFRHRRGDGSGGAKVIAPARDMAKAKVNLAEMPGRPRFSAQKRSIDFIRDPTSLRTASLSGDPLTDVCRDELPILTEHFKPAP